MRPEYCFDEIDILVNRHSLRKLFDLCHIQSQESFRIDFYTVKDTLIMEKCEKITVEHLRGSVRLGYGHNFEHSLTKFPHDLEASTSHHRALQYPFGDFRTAVRRYLRTVLDLFELAGPHGTHVGLVYESMGESRSKFQRRLPDSRVPG